MQTHKMNELYFTFDVLVEIPLANFENMLLFFLLSFIKRFARIGAWLFISLFNLISSCSQITFSYIAINFGVSDNQLKIVYMFRNDLYEKCKTCIQYIK